MTVVVKSQVGRPLRSTDQTPAKLVKQDTASREDRAHYGRSRSITFTSNCVEKERGRSVMTPVELGNIDISVLLTIPL